MHEELEVLEANQDEPQDEVNHDEADGVVQQRQSRANTGILYVARTTDQEVLRLARPTEHSANAVPGQNKVRSARHKRQREDPLLPEGCGNANLLGHS